MAAFMVEGGYPLYGSQRVSGAKNAALPILAAALICPGQVRLYDCPRLRDVENMLAILRELGADYRWETDGTLWLDMAATSAYTMPQRISKEIRSSIFMLGPFWPVLGGRYAPIPGAARSATGPLICT